MNLLEILEDETKKLVIIYPGRFHPFHIGHGKVYKYLKQKYPNAQVFISTSGKVDGDRSPFTFEEKKKMMVLAGVDSGAIVQCKSPYQSIEITERFDENKTVVVFAVSEKDMAEEPRFDFSSGIKLKKNGEPAYMQKWTGLDSAETYRKHGYLATTPTFKFKVRGQEINSASQIRNMIATSDDTKLTQMLQDLYNITDVPNDIIEIFKRKIGNKETMNENWSEYSLSEFLIEIEHEEKTMKKGILQSISEGKSPHKKGTKKYNAHMAAIHAESIDEEFDRKVKEIVEANGWQGKNRYDFDRDNTMDNSLEESEGRPYICFHVKKGKYETHATSSYDAAKNAAKHWGLKSTAGIDAHLADVEHVAEEKVEEDKYSDLNPTNKFGYFGGPGFYSNDGSTYTEPHYDDFDIRQHNRDNPEDKIKLNNWADFNLKMSYHKKDGKRVQGYGGMGYNVSFHGNPKDVEAFAMQHLDAERYSGDNIPESVNESQGHLDLGNIVGYLDTIDEYVEMLFTKDAGHAQPGSATTKEIAYRIQNAVDDIRTRELELKPSNIRAQYNEAKYPTSQIQKRLELIDLYIRNISEYVGVLNKHNDGHATPDDPSVKELLTNIRDAVFGIRGSIRISESLDDDTLIQIAESNGIGDLIVLDEDGKLVNRNELLEIAPVLIPALAALARAGAAAYKYGKPVYKAVAKKVGKYFDKPPVIGSKIKTSGKPARLGPRYTSGQGTARTGTNHMGNTSTNNSLNNRVTSGSHSDVWQSNVQSAIRPGSKMKPVKKPPIGTRQFRESNMQDVYKHNEEKIKVAEDSENIDISLGRRHTTDKVDLTRRPRYSFKGEPLDPSNEWGYDDVEVSNWKDHYSNYDDRIQRLARRKMKEWIKEDAQAEEKVSTLEKMQAVYKHNEDRNNHSENILMLAQAFGDRGEIKAIEGLLTTVRRQGYVTPEQSEVMYNSIHKKYYKELFPLNELWPALAVAGAAGYGLYKGGKAIGKWMTNKTKQVGKYAKATQDVAKTTVPESIANEIMTKAMEQSIDEDDSWKLWPSGTTGKRTAQMKAQAQDDSWKLTGTDAMRDLWYGKKKKNYKNYDDHIQRVAKGVGGVPKVTEGPGEKTHLKKRATKQAVAKQTARDSGDFPHDSPEHYIQQAAYNKKHATQGVDYKSDKHGIYGKAWDVAQQNAVKKANKQNKAADAKLVSTLPFTKSVAKGTGAKGPVGGAKAPVSTVAKPGRVKMKIKKSDLFGKGSSKSTKPSDNTIDWNLGYDDEFGSKPVTGREKILKINKKKTNIPRDDIFKGADLGHKGNWVESILHYSDAKGTPKYKEGYKAAKDGVKYEDNPYAVGHSSQWRLQWSKGHNDFRADKLTRDGKPNYGARGQFENRQVNESEFSDKQIKMAFGVLNDPRFKGGDYDGAVEVIEKIAKGLSNHPSVANALKRANESIGK